MSEKHSLDRYDGLSIYEYNKVRKAEKPKKSKPNTLTDAEILKILKKTELNGEREKEIKEEVWNFLFHDYDKEKSIYQKYHYHSYIPKPHPDDILANEAQILIRESQRKFLQTIDRSFTTDQDMYHIDLSSAYLTALANVKHSLKYNMKYPLDVVNELIRNNNDLPIHHYVIDDLFNIVRVRLEMPYDARINIFAPNNRIRYKGKLVSDLNIPDYGEIVQVRMELFVSKMYGIDSWDSFTTIFRGYDIDYKKVDVFTYDYIERSEIYNMDDVKLLLDTIKTFPKEDRGHAKKAIVSFTGQLMNIDPGRRLIMYASAEEVIRRLYIVLSRHTTVYGLQVDAVYFEPFDWPAYAHPVEVAFMIGRDVYGRFPANYTENDFSKLELWDKTKYTVTTFRIQEK